MNSSLLHRHFPVYFVWLSLMGDEWPYSCCFMGCCFHDLRKTTHRILELVSSPRVSLDSKWSKHTVTLARLQLKRIINRFRKEKKKMNLESSLCSWMTYHSGSVKLGTGCWAQRRLDNSCGNDNCNILS